MSTNMGVALVTLVIRLTCSNIPAQKALGSRFRLGSSFSSSENVGSTGMPWHTRFLPVHNMYSTHKNTQGTPKGLF